MSDRKQAFTEAIEEYDEAGLKKAVDFGQHRFVSIEHDKMTEDRFAKGHKTIRGACGHLSRAMREGDPFTPEFILDLDTGQRHELDLFVTVAPKTADAVVVVLSREMAAAAVDACRSHDFDTTADQIQKAIDGR